MAENEAIWLRLPCDDEASWKAFQAYRDQRPPRRLIRPAAGFPTAELSRWFRENHWTERVTAYDRHMDSILLAEREAALKTEADKITAEHMSILADARELAEREMAKFLADSQASVQSGAMKFADLVKLVDLVVKMDRLLQNKPGEITDTREDLSRLSIEDLREAKRLRDKADGKE